MASLVQDLIDSVFETCVDDRAGEEYEIGLEIEGLDPDTFGICVATADGQVYEVGDSRVEFCLQSISKPFTYGIALADRGIETVNSKIDVEPSGELYNEISLEPSTRRPRNPMINAGALVAANMVDGDSVEAQAKHIRQVYSAYAGRELRCNDEVFEAQLASGHRNRAIGHMLREFEILEEDPEAAHEVYLKACSTMASCHDLSLMGATWANGGLQPLTGERILDIGLTERVLSVMATCGMYDAAGRWVAEVGMAAKSGVSGGIVAVLPGQVAIAALSPRLDEHGNSIRAFRACRQLSRKLELHAMHATRGAHSAIRDSYDVRAAPSSLQRPEDDRRLLEEHGEKARIYELHGDLLFAGAESVVREVTAGGDELDLLAIDVRRLRDASDIAIEMLSGLHDWLRDHVCEGYIIDPEGLLAEADFEQEDGDENDPGSPRRFETIAAATMYFEDRLLEIYGDEKPVADGFELTNHPTLADAPDDVLELLTERMERRNYQEGDQIVAEGDEQAGLFLVTSGRVRSSLTTLDGDQRDVATFSDGSCFGEVYVLTGNPHGLAIHALGSVEAYELTRSAFEEIGSEDPNMRLAILKVFLNEIYDDIDRSLRSLAHARVAPMTST